MAFVILLGVTNANVEVPLPESGENRADQPETDIMFIDN